MFLDTVQRYFIVFLMLVDKVSISQLLQYCISLYIYKRGISHFHGWECFSMCLQYFVTVYLKVPKLIFQPIMCFVQNFLSLNIDFTVSLCLNFLYFPIFFNIGFGYKRKC